MSTSVGELPLEIEVEGVRDLAAASGACLLLDCREPDEYQLVSITGAYLIPMREVEARIGELESRPEDRLIVYCHHGGRSLQVAIWLRTQGFDRAQSMCGGIDAWAQKIDPSLPRY